MFLRLYCTSRTNETMLALLRKIWEKKTHASIVVKTEDDAEKLCSFLWTHQGDRFLPCGTQKDGHLEKQPFFISTLDQPAKNGAKTHFFTGFFPQAAQHTIQQNAKQPSFHDHIVVLPPEDTESLSCFEQVFDLCQEKKLPVMMSHQKEGSWEQTQTPFWKTQEA